MAVCIQDMKMPDNCRNCPLLGSYKPGIIRVDFCSLRGSIGELLIIQDNTKRHPDCPLRECPHSMKGE